MDIKDKLSEIFNSTDLFAIRFHASESGPVEIWDGMVLETKENGIEVSKGGKVIATISRP